jgi:hypothetical protein
MNEIAQTKEKGLFAELKSIEIHGLILEAHTNSQGSPWPRFGKRHNLFFLICL